MFLDTKDGQKVVIGRLPQHYVFADGSRTGDFPKLDVSTHIEEGFLPFSEVKPLFDSRYQYLSAGEITIAVDGQSASRTYTIVDRNIVDLKTQKKEQVNFLWKQKEQAGFSHDGKVFDSDIISVMRIATSLNATTPPPQWKTQDNQMVDITREYLQGMVDALKTHANGLFIQANIHKSSIDALESPLEVIEYDITIGW